MRMTAFQTALLLLLVPGLLLVVFPAGPMATDPPLSSFRIFRWLVLPLWTLGASVTLYEEPHLRKTFGAAYQQYCQPIPHWIPKVNHHARTN
jgi:protein-S-isoprenylcysteine O-methyltransferase Ste14